MLLIAYYVYYYAGIIGRGLTCIHIILKHLPPYYTITCRLRYFVMEDEEVAACSTVNRINRILGLSSQVADVIRTPSNNTGYSKCKTDALNKGPTYIFWAYIFFNILMV